MPFPRLNLHASPRAFTLAEVLVSALLICVGLGSILTLYTRTVHTLRATRQAAVASQVLQQRIETLRDRPWAAMSSAAALAQVMAAPTASERELADGRIDEALTVSAVVSSSSGPAKGDRSFKVRRQDGVVTIEQADDLGGEHTVLIVSTLKWRDASGPHERSIRTILCRSGLTRAGIFGSALGRPTTTSPPMTSPP